MLMQLLLVVGYDSLDMVPSMHQCVCAHKQDCGSADVGGVHKVSASLDLHAYMCTCMPWCVSVCTCVTYTLAMPSSRCVCCRSEDSFFLWYSICIKRSGSVCWTANITKLVMVTSHIHT